MKGQGRGRVTGLEVAEPAAQHVPAALAPAFTGLSLASMIDPCVRYSAVRDATGKVVDFRYEELNDAAVAYNGISLIDTIGRTLLELFPGHLAAGWFDRYVEVVETGRPVELNDVSYTLERSGEQMRQYEIRAFPAGAELVLTWRDVTARIAEQRATRESEERFRLLAEHVSDVVLELDPDGRIEWASPSATAVIGRAAEALVGTPLADLTDDDDCARLGEHLRNADEFGDSRLECRLTTGAGDQRWFDIRLRTRAATPDRPRRLVVGLRDSHSEVLARRARATLSAANAAMVRSRTVDELLAAMCEVPLSAGGYKLALYAHVDADGIATLAAHRSTVQGILEDTGETVILPERVPTSIAIRAGQLTVFHDLQDPALDPDFLDRARRGGARSCASLPVFVDGVIDGAFTVFASESDAFDGEAIQVLEDLVTQIGVGLARLRTAEKLARAQQGYSLLLTAVDQAAESIVVTDPTPAIVYANPAAVSTTGYTLEELIGQNPRIFKSGLHDVAFYEAMWAQLAGGQPFRSSMVNRRKSGDIYEEEASITPVRDGQGNIIAYVGVKHDLTRELQAEAELNRHRADRQMALDVMRDVRPAATLELTAEALAAAVRRLPGIDGVIVFMFSPYGEFIPVGATPSDVDTVQIPLGEPVSVLAAQGMIDATRRGPWWLDFSDQSGPAGLFPEISLPMAAAGFVVAAYSPIRWEGELVGALAVTSRSPDSRTWIEDRLPVLDELGTFAGMLFGASAQVYGDVHALRSRLTDLIEHEQFHMALQPVVDVHTGAVFGYEALARFDDGTPPQQRFAEARGAGLGSELEAACARRALRDAAHLPADIWLSVNFSPATVIDGTAALVLAEADDRPVVIEITEHLEIDDYPGLREAIEQCRGARLAVDDAGAGFASLRHILELRPDFVKLDLELVRDIDSDPARQALAAGLRHFCSQSGMTLIAEGVETEAEAAMLATLGVDLAQGYLYGRPAPLTPPA